MADIIKLHVANSDGSWQGLRTKLRVYTHTYVGDSLVRADNSNNYTCNKWPEPPDITKWLEENRNSDCPFKTSDLQSLPMQQESEGCFSVAFILPVQCTQLVHVADVQFLLVNLVIEVLGNRKCG